MSSGESEHSGHSSNTRVRWRIVMRPMLCPAIEDALGLVQAAAREQQLDYSLAVSAPLLDLIEIAMVGDQGFVSFFVGPVAH